MKMVFGARLIAAMLLTGIGGCAIPHAATGVGTAAGETAVAMDAVATLRQRLDQLVAHHQLPGAIVKIEQDGKILADVRTGYLDIASAKPLPEDAIFRLYSMSKPITSVAIMMLAEQGKLSVSDPLSKFLPEFASMRVYESGTVDAMVTVPADRPITIADLLTHSSGLTYHFTGDTPVHQYYRKYGVLRDTPVGRTPQDGPPARTLDELVHRLAKAPLLHEPGTIFAYSYSTSVLGSVIEHVTGKRLDAALKEMIFDPLQMKDTGFFVEDVNLDRFVTNYVASADGLTAIETAHSSDYRDHDRLLDGGGALASTARDYLHFAEMLANGGIYDGHRLLGEASVDAMFTPRMQITGLGPQSNWFGFGFALGDAESEAQGLQPAGTASWAGSGNTYFFVDRAHRAVGLLMTHVIVPPPYLNRTLEFRQVVNQAAQALIRR